MEYKVLYRKYRPTSFKSLVGQEYTKEMLQNAIINNRISHAYLFTGPRGTGKTSTAKIFAKTINCEHIENGEACGRCRTCLSFDSSPDIIEIDAASNNGVDDIRELINNVKIAPTESKYKIYIIDEVHMMTQSAFNALLLTLEEPPSHAIFIMATTNVESVPITILSRCQRFNFAKFTIDDLKRQIQFICDAEKIGITDEAVEEIAYLSEGGMRDALSLLDQLSSNDEDITIDKILSNYGSISVKFITDLIESIANEETNSINEAMQYLRDTSSDYKIFIKKMTQELAKIAVLIKTSSYRGRLSYKQIKNIIFEFNECLNKININVDPYLLIEIIILNSYGTVENNEINSSSRDKIAQILDNKKEIESNIKNDNSLVSESKNILEDFSKYDKYIKELKKIRVNNCFVDARKDILTSYKEIWNNLKSSFDLSPDILSIVSDSDIAAASEKYIILTTKLDSKSNHINRYLEQLENSFKDIYIKNPHFICLSSDEWDKEKKIYINNKKNNVPYELQDESLVNSLKPESEKSFENIVTNIFNSDKIEIV